ncbi:MAG: HlyD family secretion protein, partial [Acidimicrobiaceae bacterium]|nr:HlyD family secretion protein [Acidimicrobiaceae bacterium]
MTEPTQRAFRASALERASSPEQLDHLVGITKPIDWILALVILLALSTAVAWSVLGRIPSRASAEGIFVSSGGRLVDAVSAAPGRLASINVSVG